MIKWVRIAYLVGLWSKITSASWEGSRLYCLGKKIRNLARAALRRGPVSRWKSEIWNSGLTSLKGQLKLWVFWVFHVRSISFTYSNQIPKSILKSFHLSLLSLSIQPPWKVEGNLMKKANFSRISLEFRELRFNKVWVLHSWDSFPQEVLPKLISK